MRVIFEQKVKEGISLTDTWRRQRKQPVSMPRGLSYLKKNHEEANRTRAE